MSEKLRMARKAGKENHIEQEKIHLKLILSSDLYSSGSEKLKAGFVFRRCDKFQGSESGLVSSIIKTQMKHGVTSDKNA